jgi:hypothetical protein
MIYIRLRKRQENVFQNYSPTHVRSASRFFRAASRQKTLTFWSNLIPRLTKLLRWNSQTPT